MRAGQINLLEKVRASERPHPVFRLEVWNVAIILWLLIAIAFALVLA